MADYSYYFVLEKKIKQLGIAVDRKELIEAYTHGEYTSLKELSRSQYEMFCKALQQHYLGLGIQKETSWQQSPENKMRRKVYGLFVLKMKYSPKELEDWCCHYGRYKKPLQQHNFDELRTLVTQAENTYASYIIGMAKKI